MGVGTVAMVTITTSMLEVLVAWAQGAWARAVAMQSGREQAGILAPCLRGLEVYLIAWKAGDQERPHRLVAMGPVTECREKGRRLVPTGERDGREGAPIICRG